MMKQRSLFFSLATLPFALGITFIAPQAWSQASAVQAGESPNAASYSIEPLLGRYPADSIQSEEAAKNALKDVDDARERIEERYVLQQRACYPKFFTTACLDKVTERHRQDLASVRKIEVEANAYLRKAKVVKRDQKLTEKAAENEADAAQRAQQSQQHGAAVQEHEEQTAQQAAGKEAQRQKRAEQAARKQADYAAREQQRAENADKDAEQRAENVQKYDKKVKDAESRQSDVAKKKAQRERERAIKAAKAAKQQEQQNSQNPPDGQSTSPSQ
jgi:colicin import membrane protein